METKHTPGPWAVRSSLSHPEDYTAPDGTFLVREGWAASWSISEESDQEEGRLICYGDEIPQTLGEGLANAKLISASPDLLAACKKLRQQLKDLLSSIKDQGIEDRFRDENINMISESITAVELADDAIAKAEGK